MGVKNQAYKGEFISKNDAGLIQSVAVMLMVWHHLFGFPERIDFPYILLFDCFFHVETILSYFGRICIAIFAFSSGYGLRKKVLSSQKNNVHNNYKMIISQLFRFLGKYWVVYFVFVPLGFFLGVYSFDWMHFLKGIIGWTSYYNAEWWYITYYFSFLMLFPLISFLFDVVKRRSTIMVHIIIWLFVCIIFGLQFINVELNYLTVFLPFILGMYFVECGIYERMYKCFSPLRWFVIGFILLAGVFVLKIVGIKDYLVVPIIVYSICVIFKFAPFSRYFTLIFSFVGKYSNYIWLTHTFFAYYYFQKITFMPYISELIFIWCLALSIVSGILLNLLYKCILNFVSKFWVSVQSV